MSNDVKIKAKAFLAASEEDAQLIEARVHIESVECERYEAEIDRINNLAIKPLGWWLEQLRIKLNMSTDKSPEEIIRWAMHELNNRFQTKKLIQDLKEQLNEVRIERDESDSVRRKLEQELKR